MIKLEIWVCFWAQFYALGCMYHPGVISDNSMSLSSFSNNRQYLNLHLLGGVDRFRHLCVLSVHPQRVHETKSQAWGRYLRLAPILEIVFFFHVAFSTGTLHGSVCCLFDCFCVRFCKGFSIDRFVIIQWMHIFEPGSSQKCLYTCDYIVCYWKKT